MTIKLSFVELYCSYNGLFLPPSLPRSLLIFQIWKNNPSTLTLSCFLNGFANKTNSWTNMACICFGWIPKQGTQLFFIPKQTNPDIFLAPHLPHIHNETSTPLLYLRKGSSQWPTFKETRFELVVFLYEFYTGYRRIQKVTAPVTFGISSLKGPQLSRSSYFWVAVTFRQLKYVREKLTEWGNFNLLRRCTTLNVPVRVTVHSHFLPF